MYKKIKCPQCGLEAEGTGKVSCWCDKDFCTGQRCRANELSASYECKHCGSKGTPPDTEHYYNYHTRD